MIHTLLRSAAVAAALLTFAIAQESQPSTGSGQHQERPHPQPKREPGSQPAGETRPNEGGPQMTPRERVKCYLDAHPEVKQQLFEQADANDDGKLDESERETMRKLVDAKMQEVKEQRTDAREERREAMQERADRNGDGTVDRTERQRAQEVREQQRENRQGAEGQTKPKPKPRQRDGG